MLSRAVTAAARAASAAAPTSVITFRFPTGSRASASAISRSASRITSAGGRAAPASAKPIAEDRPGSERGS